MGGRGSGGHNRKSIEALKLANTYRKDRHGPAAFADDLLPDLPANGPEGEPAALENMLDKTQAELLQLEAVLHDAAVRLVDKKWICREVRARRALAASLLRQLAVSRRETAAVRPHEVPEDDPFAQFEIRACENKTQ